jgi:hypothetical protein
MMIDLWSDKEDQSLHCLIDFLHPEIDSPVPIAGETS